MKFRSLRADEVECRIAMVKQTGVSLLLYKDARADMRMLDEAVGSLNWERSHQLIGDRLYCTVSVWDEAKQRWISKQDVGTESYTEKEKGQASDAFKRACFCFGIGRELYTAPFIWIPSSKCNIDSKGNGYTCYDRFSVKSMEVQDGNIVFLEIINEKDGTLVFSWRKKAAEKTTDGERKMLKESEERINKVKVEALKKYFAEHPEIDQQTLLGRFGVQTIEAMDENTYYALIKYMQSQEKPTEKSPRSKISKEDIDRLSDMIVAEGVDVQKFLKLYKKTAVADLTYKHLDNIFANWDKIVETCK